MDPNKYPIERRYLPIRNNTRPGIPLSTGDPVFFVAHDTGNAGSTADQNYRYFLNLTGTSASAHTFIDDRTILEIIPTGTGNDRAEKAWHVQYNVPTDNLRFGVDANDAAIGTELCFGGAIDFDEAYARYVWYHALLCRKFNKNPAQAIVGHEHLDPARRSDPSNALRRYGRTFEQFIRDVEQELNGGEEGITMSPEDANKIIRFLSAGWFVVQGNAEAEAEFHRLANELRKASGQPVQP